MKMELLELSLSLSVSNSINYNNNKVMMMSNMQETKKRSYNKAFDDIDEEEVNSSYVVPKTLSLFVWNGSDNNPRDHNHSSSNNIIIEEEEEKGMIGWPPINRWRKKMCYYNYQQNHQGNNYVIRVENERGNNVRRSGDVIFRGRDPKSMFVKVKMEGVGIVRKVDLSVHHSFQTLTHFLMLMFEKGHVKNKGYKLTYQAKDGAWLLAGDEPWRNFIQTVQRLKLVKNGDKI